MNASLLHYRWNTLKDFGSHVFELETGCTASEELQFLALTNMTVPLVEVQSFTLKTWQSTNSQGAQIENVTYLDLETGNIVTGNTVYDWERRLTFFNYTLLTPNIMDMPAYQQQMLQLYYTASNFTLSGATAGSSCQSPGRSRQLQNVTDFLDTILKRNLTDPSSLNEGLRPTELRLPGGCISESGVNYAGEVLQSIRTGRVSQVLQNNVARRCQSLPGWWWSVRLLVDR